MNNRFSEPTGVGSADEEPSENTDELEISELPPSAPGHHFLLKLASIKQRLLAQTTTVSRATFREDTSMEDEPGTEDNAWLASGKLDIEISDLPPTRRSHYLLLRLGQLRTILPDLRESHKRKATPFSPALRRSRIRSAFTTLGICAALLVLLLGNLPGLRGQVVNFIEHTPAPIPTAEVKWTVSSMPIIVNHFGTVEPSQSHSSPGALPSTCPQISTLQYFTTPLDPPGLGASPIWLSGFTGPSAALNDLIPINAQVAHAPWPGGWYETVAVFIQKGYTGDIILHGSSQENGMPVWLSKDNPQILGTTLALSLQDGSHFIANGQWEMTSITIAVPVAGCYALQASWSGSLWTRFFAAGR